MPPFAFRVVRAQSKYETTLSYVCDTGISGWNVKSARVELLENGALFIGSGFRWDGPSGPTIDTPDFMRASLVHDVLYSIIMRSLLPLSYRKLADDLFRQHLIEDKMPRWRAWYAWVAVRAFGWIPIYWARAKRRWRGL